MSKPICVIKIDINRVNSGAGVNDSWGNWQRLFEDKLPDYHVFVLPQDYNYEERQELFNFQVFYEKDFTEIQYAELKQLIEDSLKQK